MKFIAFLLSCLPFLVFGQYDTSHVLAAKSIRIDKDVFYRILVIDSNKVGIISNEHQWIIKPEYCAIAQFGTNRKWASVKICPFYYKANEMSNWDESPLSQNWGVVNDSGKWIVEPIYNKPIDLSSQWQINAASDQTILFQNGELKWEGEFHNISHLFDNNFLLQVDGKLGIRNLAGYWVVPYGSYAFLSLNNYTYLVPNIEDGTYFSKCIKKVDESENVDRLFNYASKFELIAALVDEKNEYFGMSLANSGNLNTLELLYNDSVFGNWFLSRYFNELYNFDNRMYAIMYADNLNEFDFESVVADTAYTRMPNGWMPYNRWSESSYSIEINSAGSSTFQVFLDALMIELGTRGPAYEYAWNEWNTVAKVQGNMIELQFDDLFKKYNKSALFEALNAKLGDSTAYFTNLIIEGNFRWSILNDSLTLFFTKHGEIYSYSNRAYNYRIISLTRKELGRTFLSEKKRNKQLLKK